MRNLGTVVVVQEFSCILACGILVPPPGICVPYIGRWIFNHWTTRVKVKVKSLVHGILQARILEWVAISFSRGSSRPRDQTQVSHIACRHFNLCTNREALKYKTPSTNIKGFKGGKEARLKEEGGGSRRGGEKGVALQMSPATYRCPGVMGLFPGPPEKGGLELSPTRNQTRPEPEFEFSAKRRWSVSNPQLRLRAL